MSLKSTEKRDDPNMNVGKIHLPSKSNPQIVLLTSGQQTLQALTFCTVVISGGVKSHRHRPLSWLLAVVSNQQVILSFTDFALLLDNYQMDRPDLKDI